MSLDSDWFGRDRIWSFHKGAAPMSWQAGVGLLLAIAMMIGGAVGIGVPLALVIIWLFSWRGDLDPEQSTIAPIGTLPFGYGRGCNTAELSFNRPVYWNYFAGITKPSWNVDFYGSPGYREGGTKRGTSNAWIYCNIICGFRRRHFSGPCRWSLLLWLETRNLLQISFPTCRNRYR